MASERDLTGLTQIGAVTGGLQFGQHRSLGSGDQHANRRCRKGTDALDDSERIAGSRVDENGVRLPGTDHFLLDVLLGGQRHVGTGIKQPADQEGTLDKGMRHTTRMRRPAQLAISLRGCARRRRALLRREARGEKGEGCAGSNGLAGRLGLGHCRPRPQG